MLLEIVHDTYFEYSEPVSETCMEFRLTPLTDSSQHLLQHRERVQPAARVRRYLDSFGNTVSYFNLLAAHERIAVSFDSIVETYATPFRGPTLGGEPMSAPRARAMLYDYLQPTPLTGWGEELAAFARPLDGLRQASPPEAATEIRQAIHGGFRYEGGVTSVTSPITDLLRHGGGVCQDFAHLMLATCRWLGFPARYVSGYIFNGADEAASHAWVEVFDPDRGWFGMDPTHNDWVDEQHVRLGVGRDYRDLPPNRGLFRGQAEETARVAVSIRPVDQVHLEARARSLYAPPRDAESPPRGQRRPAPVLSLQQMAAQQQQQQQK